jgi:hypothetical protein
MKKLTLKLTLDGEAAGEVVLSPRMTTRLKAHAIANGRSLRKMLIFALNYATTDEGLMHVPGRAEYRKARAA